MLKFGADVICQSAGKQLSDADIDAIVSRSSASKSVKNGSNRKTAVPAAGATGVAKGQHILTNQKHSAVDYDASAAPLETR
jgi:hypothetical protein